ncbi:MAG: hypothetical protein AB1791_09725 [Chloroflexota bacterium]
MNDAILLALSPGEWTKLVKEAFYCCRDGRWLDLANSLLAQSSLVEVCFLDGEPITGGLRGRLTQSLLHWAVDQLRPGEAHSWLSESWSAYNILLYFFLERKPLAALAEKMALAEDTISATSRRRGEAFAAVAGHLQRELVNPRDIDGRRQRALTARYQSLAQEAQDLLRLLSIFRHPLLLDGLYQVAGRMKVASIQPYLQLLVETHLVLFQTEGEISVRPEIRPYLQRLLIPDERRPWHQAAGEYYLKERNYVESAYHWRLAGTAERAATVLLEHDEEILHARQIEELATLLTEFKRAGLSQTAWCRLKILSGRLAEVRQDIETALAEFDQALGATDLQIKAEAYYHYARVLKHRNVAEAMAYYNAIIQQLEQRQARLTILAQLYVARAWLFFHEQHDLDRAALDLQRADKLTGRQHPESWAELQLAWSQYHTFRKNLDQAGEHLLQILPIARELRDVNLVLKSLYNLGQNYDEAGQHERGLFYLQECWKLAREVGNRRLEGAANKGIGSCYFRLARLPEAIDYYLKAQRIFVEMGEQAWLPAIDYDLAEAYAVTGALSQANRFLAEGWATALALEQERWQRELIELASKYPGLRPLHVVLHPRQLSALDYVRQHGQVTNKTYRELAGISPKQAERDLAGLVDKGLLVKAGDGRATHYVIKVE